MTDRQTDRQVTYAHASHGEQSPERPRTPSAPAGSFPGPGPGTAREDGGPGAPADGSSVCFSSPALPGRPAMVPLLKNQPWEHGYWGHSMERPVGGHELPMMPPDILAPPVLASRCLHPPPKMTPAAERTAADQPPPPAPKPRRVTQHRLTAGGRWAPGPSARTGPSGSPSAGVPRARAGGRGPHALRAGAGVALPWAALSADGAAVTRPAARPPRPRWVPLLSVPRDLSLLPPVTSGECSPLARSFLTCKILKNKIKRNMR